MKHSSLLPDRLQSGVCAAGAVRHDLRRNPKIVFGRAAVVERRSGGEIVDASPCDHLGLAIDGKQLLNAWLEPGGGPPIQAIWSASPVLAYEAYHTLVYELILTDVQQAIWDGADNAALLELLARYDYLHPVRSRGPIYREYRAALGRPLPAEADAPENEEDMR